MIVHKHVFMFNNYNRYCACRALLITFDRVNTVCACAYLKSLAFIQQWLTRDIAQSNWYSCISQRGVSEEVEYPCRYPETIFENIIHDFKKCLKQLHQTLPNSLCIGGLA